MDSDDFEDLSASWKRLPPSATNLERIRQVLMVGLGVKEQKSAPIRKPQTEEETRTLVDMLNARGGVARQVNGGR